jgi:hypothetical protein
MPAWKPSGSAARRRRQAQRTAPPHRRPLTRDDPPVATHVDRPGTDAKFVPLIPLQAAGQYRTNNPGNCGSSR